MASQSFTCRDMKGHGATLTRKTFCNRLYDTVDIKSVARQSGIISNNHYKWRRNDRYQRVAMNRPLNIVKGTLPKSRRMKGIAFRRACAVRDTCHWSPFAKICLHEFSIQGAFERGEERGERTDPSLANVHFPSALTGP